MSNKPRLCVLAGPTASGKTDAAIQAALAIGAEIVSADSMQVYRGMDIGTAKATPAERARVPHHLLDVCDVWENYTAAQYQQAAAQAIQGILGRGGIPLLVGGTGLYIRAVVEGLNFAHQRGEGLVRRKWEQYLRSYGQTALHRELQAVDPVSAAKLHPNDTRRIVRALEVYELTGSPLSARVGVNPSKYDVRYAALKVDRQRLIQRIDSRVERMFDEGLVAEARRVYDSGGETAKQALGYKQLFPFFEGACDLNAAKEAVKIGTRQYAKRQMTWFRGEARAVWFEAEDPRLAERLVEFYNGMKEDGG